jgi:hypothetical protein
VIAGNVKPEQATEQEYATIPSNQIGNRVS